MSWVVLVGVLGSVQAAADEAAIGRVLDSLHERAAQADFDGYFALFHDDAVFLGTDRNEYWPLAEFKAYTKSRFDSGTGWTYRTVERFVHVAGDAAWFEERLHHDRYGEMRGTGVLLDTPAGWRVAQYNLTLPIPNALFAGTASEIDAYYGQDRRDD
ncbi:MAG: nuclear transport factor 2 family protein [Pseudomonadales bacterium]